MTLIDVSVTNVALPSISQATSATSSQLQWMVTGYTLAFGLVPVLGGKLGDDHGRRRMFQWSVGSFAVASVLVGIAPTAGTLVAARVLQGLAGGLINPQVSGLVQQLFPGPERGRAFGVIGTTVGLGTALGPLIGGALIAVGGEQNGWRLVFFINVPIGIVVMWLGRTLLPAHSALASHRLDLLGAALLGGGIFCVLFAAVQYDTLNGRRLTGLAVAALSLLTLFIRRERRLTVAKLDPLVNVSLFREPSYTGGALLALAFFPATTGLPLVLALYYQEGLGYTALQSGIGVSAYAIGSGISAPLAGRVVTRIGRPLIVVASVVFGLGGLALVLLAHRAPEADVALVLAPALFVIGAAQGAIITPNQALTLMEVDPAVGSVAGGVLLTAQRIGQAVGQAVVGAVFFAGLRNGITYADAFGIAVLSSLGFAALAVVVGTADLIGSRWRGAITRRGDRMP